jgi:hypothetical protein
VTFKVGDKVRAKKGALRENELYFLGGRRKLTVSRVETHPTAGFQILRFEEVDPEVYAWNARGFEPYKGRVDYDGVETGNSDR